MEISRPVTGPLQLVNAPFDDRLALEARTDVEAFAPLYEQHVDQVFRYLRARGCTEDDAAELTSLTFERALRHIKPIPTGGCGLRPLAFRIARNASIDASRRRRDRPLDPDHIASLADPDRTPEAAAIAAEEQRWIHSLVAGLPDVHPDALALRFAAGLSSREIAIVIGKSEAATKSL